MFLGLSPENIVLIFLRSKSSLIYITKILHTLLSKKMKKNFPKLFLFAIVSILIFPQVSFAAWWNPFSWKVFNKAPTAKVQEVKQPTEIEKLKSEVAELKKKVATPVTSPAKPS